MNNNARVFLWIGLVLILWLNYDAWQRDYRPKPAPNPAAANASGVASMAGDGTTGASNQGSLDSTIPQAAQTVAAAGASTAPAAPGSTLDSGAAAVSAAPGSVRVVTDVIDLEIGLLGGELRRADLLKYPLVKGEPTPVRLFNRDSPLTTYVMQTGLSGPAGADGRPTHLATFTAPSTEFRLQPGSDEVRVPLKWTDPAGVTVTKTYIFKRGHYRIDLEYQIDNKSGAEWAAASYAQIVRTDPAVEVSMFRVESYAFRGPAIYDGEKYSKLKIEDDENHSVQRDIQGGWMAGMQHHFVSVVVPNAESKYRYNLRVQGREYLLSTVGPLKTVAAGASGKFTEALFVGPKLQAELATVGKELDLVADYGMLTILARPLFWLLDKAHGIVGNWGLAIILVTLLLKLFFYPLSEASGKSMAKMRTLAPRIKNLQETYKDDRQKLGEAMMEMYKREKINPVSGCLPMLVQMPVFIAFYWVLLESVEMRQAPFFGWIQDLSSRDPFFILPILNGLAMYGQYKLNPAPPDPIQAKVFQFMPIIFSVMFALFPSGLVLYWVTNTVLSIAQQWNINRRIEAAAKRT
jgi:YidC/Oxa1 family membrane protein insertase